MNGEKYAEVYATPEWAKQFQLGRNRKLSKPHIRYFKRILQRGEMHRSGDMILIDSDGYFRNGQHRIAAMLETGIPFHAFVIYNTTEETIKATDQGKIRTTAHVFDLFGFNTISGVASLVRGMMSLPGTMQTRPGVDEVIQFADSHIEALQFVSRAFGGCRSKGVGTVPVKVAAARAFYYIDESIITRFADVLLGRRSNRGPDESAAIALLRHFTKDGKRNGGGQMQQKESYLRSSHAIELFAQGAECTIVRAVANDPFPLMTAEQLGESGRKIV